MTTSHIIGNGSLVAHAFNADLNEMAVSLNTSDVYVLAVAKNPNEKFKVLSVLSDHTGLVTGIDWAKKTDNLVTCSSDRNAYVWYRTSEKEWKPILVVLNLQRAVTCVRWSPNETKFAAGSSSKILAVASFEKEFNFWTAKQIKKSIRSTITCLDWHPEGALVACGSTDFKARIFYVEKEANIATNWGTNTSFGLVVFDSSTGNGGWVHSIAFSEGGDKLVWVSHSSQVFVADCSSGAPAVISIKSQTLPFTACLWVDQNSILVAGHDCAPYVFSYDGKSLSTGKMLSQESGSNTGAMSKISAMRLFQDIDRTATTEKTGSKLTTIHQNTIREIRSLNKRNYSTIGSDGLLVFWDLDRLLN
ncbi:Polycomb protein sop-2 [Cichlidogyrus casuarinus]|uniref:Arp2/3 complex 41 kDa subunit n=1 Tax=Cichlidogyrus casuarinus TaxID=1844966 RepID=A0ABD2PU53_9PLAT